MSIGSTLGALFLGSAWNDILYGATCLQAFLYYKRSRNDNSWFRILMFSLWLLDTLQTAIVIQAIYWYIISHFGNTSTALLIVWGIPVQLCILATNIVICRIIFARRAWLITGRSVLLATCIVSCSLIAFVTTLIFAIKAFSAKTYSDSLQFYYFTYTAFGTGVAADVLITSTLCTMFYKGRTGYLESDFLLGKLTCYTLTSSGITTATSAATLLTAVGWPHQLIALGLFFSLGKLHLNTLLATLNARPVLARKHILISRPSSQSSRDVSSTEELKPSS